MPCKDYKKRQEYQRQRRYGISAEEYERLFAEQNGCCAICLKPETKTINGNVVLLSVDHDHETKKVCGLLCYRCNTIVGKSKEQLPVLRSAIEYLERTRI